MKKILLTTLSLVTIMSAYASDPVYIDADVGLNTSWNNYALGLDAGYSFGRHLAAEVGYTYSPGYTYNYSGGSYNTNYYMFDIAAKGTLPITDTFNIYGKLGAGYNNYNSWGGCNGCSGPSYSGTNTGIFYGGGAEFVISREWNLHLEDYTVTGSNPNFLMFGATYKF
jgi:opacity protein-like surface antigen